ncbi:MAG: ASCH domain-containing protein [Bacilli bacterium]|jgi:ASC-1-like (ASCH) protein
MIHYMNLWNDSFQSIKKKTKTIEMRLNDEKRQLLNINDIIVFKNTRTNEEIKVKVISLKQYKNFDDLYQDCNKIEIGYREDEEANPDDMLAYYSKEQIEKYGALAIKVEVISS